MTTDVIQTIGSWRKPSRSNGGNGNCVEVGRGAGVVGVRDTKDRTGGMLAFAPEDWATFLCSL